MVSSTSIKNAHCAFIGRAQSIPKGMEKFLRRPRRIISATAKATGVKQKHLFETKRLGHVQGRRMTATSLIPCGVITYVVNE